MAPTAREQNLLELRLRGWTYRRIAAHVGISRQRVQQLLMPPAAIRALVVAKTDGLCATCGLDVWRGGHVHHLQAHGVTPDTYNDLANLTLLCLSCHRRAHDQAQSLRPPRPPKNSDAVALGRLGGLASAERRRQKKKKND